MNKIKVKRKTFKVGDMVKVTYCMDVDDKTRVTLVGYISAIENDDIEPSPFIVLCMGEYDIGDIGEGSGDHELVYTDDIKKINKLTTAWI